MRVRLARALHELAKAEAAALQYASWFRPGAERRTGGDDDAVIDDPEYGAARTDRSHQQPDEGR